MKPQDLTLQCVCFLMHNSTSHLLVVLEKALIFRGVASMCTPASVWLLSCSDMPLYAGMCILGFRLTWFHLSWSLSLHQRCSFWAGDFTSNAGRHWWWILIALTSCCDKAKHISVLWLVARELRMASHGFHLLQGPLGLQNSVKPQSRIRLLII